MTGKNLLIGLSYIDRKYIEESEKDMPALKAAPSTAGKERPRSGRLSARKLWLVAAMIVLALMLVGCAVVCATILFRSPGEMITALYGENAGFASAPPTEVTDPWKADSAWTVPGYEREPVEETVARELEKWVSPVGQSIEAHGNRLTVDAFLYDSVTQSGLITLLLEHQDPIPEEELHLGYNGEIGGISGSYLYYNQYGRMYLIPDKTTDTQLAFTYYFRMDKYSGDSLIFSFVDFEEQDKTEALEQLRQEEIPKIRQRLMEELTAEEAAQKCQEVCGFCGYPEPYDDYYFLAANEFDTAHEEENRTQYGKDMDAIEKTLREELTPEEARARLKTLWGEALYEEVLAGRDQEEETALVYHALAQRTYDQTHRENRIFVTLPDNMAMPNRTFGNGDVLINSLCVQVDSDQYAGEGSSPSTVILHRKDGSAFVVRDGNTDNALFCRGIEGGKVLYMLNSAINIDTIGSVEVAGELASAVLEADSE